ncbi:MAG TPA: DUF1206 domain-containing protein [Nocardioidaceae bacterium]|nr:DUF1206 domain-containing protein [Nocardioidaceae bacterium]
MNAQTLAESARQNGRAAKHHPVLDALARGGLVAYGLVYLLLGWLALQVALQDPDGAVDKNGALHQLAEQPWGEIALWAAVVGLSGLTVWQLLEAATGHHDRSWAKRWAKRGRSVFRAVVFATIAVSAAKVAFGDSSGKSTDSYTAKLMQQPLGPWLVGVVGLAIIAFAIGSAVIGLTDRFKHDLDHDGRTGGVGTALAALARTGYCSRGAAFGIMGSLFVWAAVTHEPRKSGGLDQALGRLLQAPAGPLLLGAVALGFACYGLYNIAKAKHLKN